MCRRAGRSAPPDCPFPNHSSYSRRCCCVRPHSQGHPSKAITVIVLHKNKSVRRPYLNCIEITQIPALEIQILIARPDVYAAIQLPERFLPRIRQLRFFRTNELETARRRIKQWQVIFVYTLIKTLPEISVCNI